MKAFKRIAIIGAAVLVLGATTLSAAAFSGDYQTPAEIVAGLTGQSADTVIAQRS